MPGIEEEGGKTPEKPTNIIFHRFRELNYIGNVQELKGIMPWKIRKIMRKKEPLPKDFQLKIPLWHPARTTFASSHQRDQDLIPHGTEITYLIGQKLFNYDILDSWRKQLNSMVIDRSVIEIIKASDPERSDIVEDLYVSQKLGFVIADINGRPVFLPEERLRHLTLEIRKHDWSTRLEQITGAGIMSNNFFNLLQLIHEIVATGNSYYRPEKKGVKESFIYSKAFNNRPVEVATARNGMITTVIVAKEKVSGK